LRQKLLGLEMSVMARVLGKCALRFGVRTAAGVGLLVAAVALGACQKKTAGLEVDPLETASTSAIEAGPSFRKTETLAKQWEANPGDVNTGLAYADSLGDLGQRDTQLGVLAKVAESNPTDGAAQAVIGKKLLALGDGASAEAVLTRAVRLKAGGWQTYSALGTALDQQARHAEARQYYEQALAAKPGELSVMNNLAMSYALQGKLPEAEKILRQAMAYPDSKSLPRIRQNLALVVGLQGRFEESQKIASEDLPPNEVEANLAYLKQMLSRPNTWAQLQDNGG
jgi:Flp pilus assembly protein TadD